MDTIGPGVQAPGRSVPQFPKKRLGYQSDCLHLGGGAHVPSNWVFNYKVIGAPVLVHIM